MLQRLSNKPHRVLMTLDAVGGVWRYAMTLGAGLANEGIAVLFVGLGPKPSASQRAEAERIGELAWLDLPLDWLAADGAELDEIPAALEVLAEARDADLLHLNLPSQAGGLVGSRPVLVVAHSCVVTWFRSVRGTDVPSDWRWHYERNAVGLRRADAVLVPSRSHGDAIHACYGAHIRTMVCANAAQTRPAKLNKRAIVVAAGRWWDEGKNGVTLDKAAAQIEWPVLMAGASTGPNGATIDITNAQALGELSNFKLRALLARAAIVASPSIYEPFGLVALESAQAGAALVLADIPTYRELWAGAATFVSPTDAAAWAEAINALASDKPRRDALADAARQRSQLYSAEAQLKSVLSAYSDVITHSVGPKMVA